MIAVITMTAMCFCRRVLETEEVCACGAQW
jgi:hypothetical protein